MEIFLSLLYTALFIFLIHKMNFFDVKGLSRKTISVFFIIKILFGLSLWWVRFGNDMSVFFDDAAVMFNAIYHHPMHYVQMVLGINSEASYLEPYYKQMENWYRKPWIDATHHNNRIMIQFNAFVYLFSFGYYYVHTVFMCFLSLIGLTGIYKTFAPIMKNKIKELAFAVFLIPSVLFWGSGVLKEGIILFGLGMLIYNLYKFLFYKISFIGFFWIILCSIIIFFTKIYVFAAFIPSFISLILLKWTGNKYVFLKFFGVHLLLFFLAMNMYRISFKYNILDILKDKQWFLNLEAKKVNAHSIISIKRLQLNTVSLVENAPEAIVNTLFRPHLFESKTFFMFVSALENLFLIILALTSFVFFKKPDKESLPLLYTSVSFVLTLALLIGIVSPVLGSIVRFRIPLLPFFAIIFFALLDKEKMIKRMALFTTSLRGTKQSHT